MENPYLEILDFCLLIPCYDNLAGLILSLRSIHYPPEKFYILIIDDGSRQPLTRELLQPHLPEAFSFEIVRIDRNTGITHALNTGLQRLEKLPPTCFIARLDCGDICAKDRFEKQVSFLRHNPGIDLVGSWCWFREESSGISYQYKTPTEHAEIQKSMYFRNVLIHPTVMWRYAAIKDLGQYPEDFPHAEDYGFFYKILSRKQCAIIPEHLLTCEINPKGISMTYRKQQLMSRVKVLKTYGENPVLRLLGIVKLRAFMLIPYEILLKIKEKLYGNRRKSASAAMEKREIALNKIY